MVQLVLQCKATETRAVCGLCAQPLTAPAGNQLFLAGSDAPVCQDCARRHDPSLAALVYLAREAERVGRMGRHLVSPPMTALLDLASAAERYAAAGPGVRDQAAAIRNPL